MEWLLIPMSLVTILIVFGITCKWRNVSLDNGYILVFAVISIVLIVLAFIICPCSYYDTKTKAIGANAYWETFILPNIIEETDSYVIIKNQDAGIWQSGGYNLASFNQYLDTTRYWDDVPIINSCVHPPKEHLKLVRVSLGD